MVRPGSHWPHVCRPFPCEQVVEACLTLRAFTGGLSELSLLHKYVQVRPRADSVQMWGGGRGQGCLGRDLPAVLQAVQPRHPSSLVSQAQLTPSGVPCFLPGAPPTAPHCCAPPCAFNCRRNGAARLQTR